MDDAGIVALAEALPHLPQLTHLGIQGTCLVAMAESFLPRGDNRADRAMVQLWIVVRMEDFRPRV